MCFLQRQEAPEVLGSGQRVSCFDFQGGQLSQNHSLPNQSHGGQARMCVHVCVCPLCSIARLASTRGRTLSAIVHVGLVQGAREFIGPQIWGRGKNKPQQGLLK